MTRSGERDWRQATDVAKLLAVLPDGWVHVGFLGAIVTGILQLMWLRGEEGGR